jgi:hypothetical protein
MLATNVCEHEEHEKVHLKPCYGRPQRKKLQNNHKKWDWKTTNMIKKNARSSFKTTKKIETTCNN